MKEMRILNGPMMSVAAILTLAVFAPPSLAQEGDPRSRPLDLVRQMDDSALKTRLLACADAPVTPTLLSIGHRGAPLGYAEHTVESYQAAAAMGAGIVECDVTFTRDKELVCRHAQNDNFAHTCTSPSERMHTPV